MIDTQSKRETGKGRERDRETPRDKERARKQ